MRDPLVHSRAARTLIKTLRLPVPLPQPLARETGPWTERPLHGHRVAVHAEGALTEALAATLPAAGADPFVIGDLEPWTRHGEAWGRPPEPLTGPQRTDAEPADALVFDATALETPESLRALYDFFHPRVRGLSACGRVVVLSRPPAGLPVVRAAAQRAVEGFVRSLGREVGRRGATANLVVVHEGAEDRLEPVLRFLLSPRSAYVSGQALEVTKRVKASESVRRTRTLQGKHALVTGAARGIGAAIARALAREGAHVLCLDRPGDEGPLAQVADEVRGTPLVLDVTDPAAIAAIVGATAPLGGLDVVVHNAGVTRDKTLANLTEAWWDLTLGINLVAVARMVEELPINKDGRIVCLSSIAGIAGNVGQTNYSASKAGIIGLVEASAPRLARRGVAINAIAPGFIETRLTQAIPAATREVARRMCSLAQGGLPEDIAEVATFLASPGAHGLSGAVLRVCGGNLVGA